MWGLDFSLTTLARTRRRRFSPASVRGLSAWYDPSDLSTLFRDTAMTVPVTAAGQSVAALKDKSGRGRHMVQATASARPTYGTDGTLHWLAFDGIDDSMTTPVQAIAGTSVFCGACFAPVTGFPTSGNGGVFSDASYLKGGIQMGWERQAQRINTNSMSSEWLSNTYAFSNDIQRRNVQGVFTGTGSFVYFYGIGSVAVTTPIYASSTIMPLTLGKGTQGGRTGAFSGKLYGAVYAEANASEATNLLGWLHGKCGLSM